MKKIIMTLSLCIIFITCACSTSEKSEQVSTIENQIPLYFQAQKTNDWYQITEFFITDWTGIIILADANSDTSNYLVPYIYTAIKLNDTDYAVYDLSDKDAKNLNLFEQEGIALNAPAVIAVHKSKVVGVRYGLYKDATNDLKLDVEERNTIYKELDDLINKSKGD